jgi:AraC-like DNA-binding protein
MGTSVLFVQALVEALERSGVSRERFLLAAPIDPAKLEQPDARLDLATFDALLELALSLTRDEAFGLHMGDMVNPGNYSLTVHLAAHATTLRDAIGSLQRFYRLLTDRPFWRLVESDRTASLLYDAGPGASPARRFRAELTMTGLYKLLKYFDPRARPRVVAFDYQPPRYSAEYSRLFGGVERFGQKFTGIVFDRKLLGALQIHRDPELHATIVSRAETRVSKMVKGAGYSERIRRHILDGAAPNRHDMQTMARALGLSARSLRRRLAEEGTSFRDVVDAALGTLAKRLVSDKDRPIEAVAYAMGYSHPSAFHRAFKRWTGATPAASRSSRYRDHAAAGVQESVNMVPASGIAPVPASRGLRAGPSRV